MTQTTALDYLIILLALWLMNESAQTVEEIRSVEMAIAAVQRMIVRSM